MLGVKISPHTLYAADLEYKRFKNGENFSGFGPSIVDPYTVYLIWEELKTFNLPGYSLVRMQDGPTYKSGFKKDPNKAVLLYSSNSEGRVALRMWLWCASKDITSDKE
tara:strand:- start:1930 stop:2253 length:324 start_codon:yes stop_codon:yes gene_type:complete